MTYEVEGKESKTKISFPQLRFVQNTGWRDFARCSKLPKYLFFDYNESFRTGNKGKKQSGDRLLKIKTARAVCKLCPVKEECYEFAVKNNEPYGIWAGTLPEERRILFTDFKKTGILETLQKF